MNPSDVPAPAVAPAAAPAASEAAVAAALQHLHREAARVVVGQELLLEFCCLGLLARGHLLLEGPPGVAKTLAVKVFARILGLDYQRIQGTPDLLPGDIAGGNILGADGRFTFRAGPLFAGVVLVDEINRMPPRTQAALLEAMQERQVTVDREAYPLPESFTVFATQNPVEFEGTYPLPEAQLDRFLMKLDVGYPSEAGEIAILGQPPDPAPLTRGLEPLPAGALAAAQAAIAAVRAEPPVVAYVAALVRQTRAWPSILLGASPRAGAALLQMARALAAAEGRDFAIPDDVKAATAPVLRHRLRLRPEAEMEGRTPDAVLEEVLAAVAVPR